MEKNTLTKKIKQAIHDVEPGVDDIRTDRIRHRLYEIEWETGEVISSIVRNHKEWNSDLYQTIPFHQRIVEEGINL